MAARQAEGNVQKVGRQRSVPKDQQARPQGIKKEQPQPSSPKSARLQRYQKRTISKDTNARLKHPLPSSTSNTPGKEFPKDISSALQEDQKQKQKRKQAQEPKEPPICVASKHLRNRPQTSVAGSVENTPGQPAADRVTNNKINSILYWIEKDRWPKEYFDQDDQNRKDFEKDSWFEKFWEPENNMSSSPARKKLLSFLRGKQSEANSVTASSSNQKPKEVKNTPYQDACYEIILATKGSFMEDSELGATGTSESACQTFLETEQILPDNSLFCDDLFDKTCKMVKNKNETRVVRDLSLLIVPSAEILAIRGAEHLKILIESVNESWNSSIPITKTRPQPDYSVGFRREAFTEDQLKRLEPFVGKLKDTSFFMATYMMYFPFLTCEVKCGAAALEVADRQNAHSMTIAVRGIIELFRLVKREKELHREILAFSVSHDHRTVRIYGHYAIIDGSKTTFYRHPIHIFDIIALKGKEKWTAYKFIKNVYDMWMPIHFNRICSVIDELPSDIDFEISQLLDNTNSQSSRAASLQDVSSDTSLSQRLQGSFKKLRKRGRPVSEASEII